MIEAVSPWVPSPFETRSLHGESNAADRFVAFPSIIVRHSSCVGLKSGILPRTRTTSSGGSHSGWRVTEVRHTPFGDELLEIVFNEIERELFAHEKCAVEFGVWQPVLRSYFPRWTNNLKVAEPEFRDGIYYFKVSLSKPWRRIAIPAKSDLDDLAECIIRAFNFDGDHLYGFQFVARDGHQIRVEHPGVGRDLAA